MTPEKYPLYVTAKDSIKIVERPISSTKTPKPKAEPKSTERFRDMSKFFGIKTFFNIYV